MFFDSEVLFFESRLMFLDYEVPFVQRFVLFLDVSVPKIADSSWFQSMCSKMFEVSWFQGFKDL